MKRYDMTADTAFSISRTTERVNTFLHGVYGWMCAGLIITAITARVVSTSPAITDAIAANNLLFWLLAIAQLAIVFVLSAQVERLAASTASFLFVVYSALTGVTVSFVLLVFTGESVAATFFITAGMFGGLALYGTVTRRNLQGLGQFLFMGLLGIVLASIVGLFWHSDALQFVISFAGVIVFTGLTAYDAQRLNSMALSLPPQHIGSYTVVGALALYLDFINLFLSLLRFFGRRRE